MKHYKVTVRQDSFQQVFDVIASHVCDAVIYVIQNNQEITEQCSIKGEPA